MIDDCRPLEVKLEDLVNYIYQFIQRKITPGLSEPYSWYGEINQIAIKRLKKIIKEEINERNS